MKVYIDVVTGTWGDVAGLRIVDLDKAAAEDVGAGDKLGHDAYSLLAFMESVTPAEVIRFGQKRGRASDDA